jgi:2OG-Fe(II) oxygenase superfamily
MRLPVEFEIDQLTPRIVTLFDEPHYARLALKYKDQFKSNDPYPHIVLDNFLPADVAKALAQAYPDPNDSSVRWKTHANKNVVRKFVEDVSSLSMPMRLLANAVISRQCLLFLEALTGIDCLFADPYFIGGGAMATGPGEFLKIHADFNWHHKLQAHRRLNVLLYLAPDWKTEWGGQLELWSKDMTRKVQIEPIFNRAVIFEVTDDSNHGQPQPLQTPPGVYRRVFSTFYYTTRKTDAEWDEPHFTLYKPEKSPYGMSLQKDYQAKAKTDVAE